MTTRDPNTREDAVIRALTRHVERPGTQVDVPIGDDAGVVRLSGSTVVTTDTLVEGTHFRLDWSTADAIGYRAMVSAISDVYAMGGSPTWATVAAMAPGATSIDVFDDIGRGVAGAATEHRTGVIGGDVARGPCLALTVTVLGHVDGAAFRLDGAAPGDAIVVTGPIGGGRCALDLLEGRGDRRTLEPHDQQLVDAFLRPRVDRTAATRLRRFTPTAVTDVSDGVFAEAHRMATRSGTDFLIERVRLPLTPSVRARLVRLADDPELAAMSSGEEYQLVATLPPWPTLFEQVAREGWSVIGSVAAPADDMPRVRWTDSGDVIDGAPYWHFT